MPSTDSLNNTSNKLKLYDRPIDAIFVDIDGTLSAFHLDPQQSFIPIYTLNLLQTWQQHGVLVAAVTGRSLIEARRILAPLNVPIAGSHGLEFSLGMERQEVDNQAALSTLLPTVALVKDAVATYCHPIEGILIEHKPYSVALHVRANPQLAEIAADIAERVVVDFPDWQVKAGKYVWELAPCSADKGKAITRLLSIFEINAANAVFIGDDMTDEAGFVAIQSAGGLGVKVGLGDTQARHRVADIAAVQRLLASGIKTSVFE